MKVHRRRIVGVVGSLVQVNRERAFLLGRLLADTGYDLLTLGQGGTGRAVAEAFVQVPGRTGLSLGICPGELGPDGHVRQPGVPHAFVELAVHTHLPTVSGIGTFTSTGAPRGGCDTLLSLTADALLVLPGEQESRSVAELASRLARPTLLYGSAEDFTGFPETLERTHALSRVGDFLFGALLHP